MSNQGYSGINIINADGEVNNVRYVRLIFNSLRLFYKICVPFIKYLIKIVKKIIIIRELLAYEIFSRIYDNIYVVLFVNDFRLIYFFLCLN